jgi:hypothetical protein
MCKEIWTITIGDWVKHFATKELAKGYAEGVYLDLEWQECGSSLVGINQGKAICHIRMDMVHDEECQHFTSTRQSSKK